MVTLLLILILTSPSIPVVVVASRVTSTSFTHGGQNDVVRLARRGEGRRGLDDRVRRRPDTPHSQNTPVGVAVEVTILMASLTTMTMAKTTTTVMRTPAGARRVAQDRRAARRMKSSLPSAPSVIVVAGAAGGVAGNCRRVAERRRAVPSATAVISRRLAHQGHHRQRSNGRESTRRQGGSAGLTQDTAKYPRLPNNLPTERKRHDMQVKAIDVSSSPPERFAYCSDDARGKDEADAATGARRAQHAPYQEGGIADAGTAKETEELAPEAREPPDGAGRLTKAGTQQDTMMAGRVEGGGATPPGSSRPEHGINTAAALGPPP